MLFATKPLPPSVQRALVARSYHWKSSHRQYFLVQKKIALQVQELATVTQQSPGLPRFMSSSSSSSAVQAPDKVRNGSCLCRSIQYQVVGEPFTMRVCHCVNCKKATGAAFMTNVFFKDKQIRVLSGETKLKVYADGNTASGTPLNRYFCGECGSNLFLKSQIQEVNGKKNDVHILASGTLDDKVDWIPKTELFKEQRQHFVTGIETQKKETKL